MVCMLLKVTPTLSDGRLPAVPDSWVETCMRYAVLYAKRTTAVASVERGIRR
jgi:hypothetical protein